MICVFDGWFDFKINNIEKESINEVKIVIFFIDIRIILIYVYVIMML